MTRILKSKDKKGFTLIELLVVIAIIAILAAILFPVFAKAKSRAQQSTCQNNLKQLSLAMIQYAQDYDEVLPPYFYKYGNVSYWWATPKPDANNVSIIDSYIKSTKVASCPANPPGRKYTYGYNTYLGSIYDSAKANPGVYDANHPKAASVSGVARVANQILIADSHNGGPSGFTEYPYIPYSTQPRTTPPTIVSVDGYDNVNGTCLNCTVTDPGTSKEVTTGVHNGSVCVAFLDGHVKAMSPSKLIPAAWDIKTPPTDPTVETTNDRILNYYWWQRDNATAKDVNELE